MNKKVIEFRRSVFVSQIVYKKRIRIWVLSSIIRVELDANFYVPCCGRILYECLAVVYPGQTLHYVIFIRVSVQNHDSQSLL